MSITITGLKTLDYTTKAGTRFIARFDVQLDGLLTMQNLSLCHKDPGNYHVMPPELLTEGSAIRFTKALRTALCQQAMAAYAALRETQEDPNKPEVSAAVALVRQIEERDAA